MENQSSNIARKLGEISRIMADGYYFTNMRILLEKFEADAEALGDKNAQTILIQVERFYNLCKLVEKQ